MIKHISISNYKSIINQEFSLGQINVFIGENGCGKSNILEAIGMFCAAQSDELKNEHLINRGIRVTKPSLTYNSFISRDSNELVTIELVDDNGNESKSQLYCDDKNDITSNWIDKNREEYRQSIKNLETRIGLLKSNSTDLTLIESIKETFLLLNNGRIPIRELKEFVIYNAHSNALRGISNESKRDYLGIYGEGLDTLLSTFNEEQLSEIMDNQFISWLDRFEIDNTSKLKNDGYKLGRSNSNLYFTDKYMKRGNKLFSAENANEGALHILFYLALFISEKTPQFFAIDNIENALNPKLCRELMVSISKLAKRHNKQALITTHNPAILDGLNLNDESQKLFVVKRADDGQTIVEQIKSKPQLTEGKYKLSELWMRGYLGGVPNNF